MLGRHVAPAPFVANAVMAPIALQIAGSAEQKRTWLPKLASGAARACVAVSGAASGERAAGVTSHGGLLTGNCYFALDAAGAAIPSPTATAAPAPSPVAGGSKEVKKEKLRGGTGAAGPLFQMPADE